MKNHITDIIVRSIKTFAAAFVATLVAGGVNVDHLTITKQLAIAGLAAGATAVLNAGLKVHAAVTSPTLTPQ